MKSLQTIQKIFRIFEILTKIAMILSFVWAGLAVLGLLCGIVWYQGGIVVGAAWEPLYSLAKAGGLTGMAGVLLTNAIFALTDGVLLVFALRYFRAERDDGTPFTKRGAEQLKHLGIRTIVLPLAAAILIAMVCAIFDLPQNAGGDWDDLTNVTVGLFMGIASLIFRYGAELEENRALPSAD